MSAATGGSPPAPRPDPLPVEPLGGRLAATVAVPGSKSITNRALVCAALARGTSTLAGALRADDTEAMLGCLRALGIAVEVDGAAGIVEVAGQGGRIPAAEATLDCRLSGTTSRFVLPVAALGEGRYLVDGAEPLRARPMGPALAALRDLDLVVDERGAPGCLPVELAGGPAISTGELLVASEASSQFLSGLLLAAPCVRGDDVVLRLPPGSSLVSGPYVAMTRGVMADFGAPVHELDSRGWVVPGTGYEARSYAVEPDASAASYFFAAAALLGGSVTVEGLGSGSLQGDLAFVDVLERMGATVHRDAQRTTVTGTGVLHGGTFDLGDLSDTAQTLAAVAPFADAPVTVTGIGFIRRKETDRIAAVVTELRRLGVTASEDPDGFTIQPWPAGEVESSPGVRRGSEDEVLRRVPRAVEVQTYEDHRMAMAFSLLGLRVRSVHGGPGVAIADPGCVAKTFPGYWDALDALRAQVEPGS